MADVWGDFEADVASIVQSDGDTVTWTVGVDDSSVLVFWRGDHVEDEGMGPRMVMAEADVPTGGDLGDTITRDTVTYTVARFLPDGHGVLTVLLKD